MKVLIEGHKYVLDNFDEPKGLRSSNIDNPYHNSQLIQFIDKRNIDGSNELVTVNNGTTNEEVLMVLIDRMNYLQSQFPCRENAIVISKLEESLMWLNKRTEDRKKRGVEGKQVR